MDVEAKKLKLDEIRKLLNETEIELKQEELLKKPLNPPSPIPPPPPIKNSEELKIPLFSNNIKRLYYILGGNFLLVIIINMIMMFTGVNILWLFVFNIFAFPLFIMSILFLIMRVKMDSRKLIDVTTKKLSKNAIICYFFSTGLKLNRHYLVPDKNEIKYNGGLYFIDSKSIFLDSENRPCIFYLSGIPNPLKFNFFEYINKFRQIMESDKELLDFEGDAVEVSYSSDTIQEFKKDKFIRELHTSTGDIMKAFMMVGGIVIVFCITLVLVIIFIQ